MYMWYTWYVIRRSAVAMVVVEWDHASEIKLRGAAKNYVNHVIVHRQKTKHTVKLFDSVLFSLSFFCYL